MGRKAKYKILENPERNCPVCGDLITYCNKHKASRAEAMGTACVKCSRKKVANLPDVIAKKKATGEKNKEAFLKRMQLAASKPEAKQKHKDALKAYFAIPENRKKVSDRLVRLHANPDSVFNSSSYKEKIKVAALKGLMAAHLKRGPLSSGEKELAEAVKDLGFVLNTGRKRVGPYIPDIISEKEMIIIEFFGDYYHCNPSDSRYVPTFWNKCKKKTAEQVRSADIERIRFFEEKGFKVLIVWERDWRDDRLTMTQDMIALLKAIMGIDPSEED